MKRRTFLAGAVLSFPRLSLAAQPLTLQARDGGLVYGEYMRAEGARRGVILLFHMAGSNRGEYAPIAPELARLGWDTIAIDQRSGGSLWGRANETVQHRRGSTDFNATLPDLEAALAYTAEGGRRDRVLVWGSSYSAALVFVLAAAHPQDVAGVLAFSPDEFIVGHSIRAAAAKLVCPIFVTSADDPGEVAAARDIIAAAPARLKCQFVPKYGIHGSSTLRQDDNPQGFAENWEAVRGFLDTVATI
jgi:pimeloyl-ACP methyl ester carboxylesterase